MTVGVGPRLWLSTGEVCQQAGLPLSKIVLWKDREGVIAPSVRAGRGSGNHCGWSQLDVDVLRAIAAVYRDLHAIGCVMPVALVARLWRDLHADGHVDIDGTAISLHVSL